MYTELHARSALSFLRGASLPEHLSEAAAVAGLPGMAVCDRNGLYGAPRLYSSAKATGVRPIVGCEVVMEDGSVVPVLVATRAGYRGLCRMLTQSALRAPKGEARTTWAELRDHRDGLIALTGDAEGPLAGPINREDRKAADQAINRLVGAMGRENVFVEIQRHRQREDIRIGEALVEIAQAHQLPMVATNGVAYASPAFSEVLDVFSSILNHTTLDRAGRLLCANEERHVKSPREMMALFADLPEAIANTERIADRIEFSLENLGYAFPSFPVPSDETMDSFLRIQTEIGARSRYGTLTPTIRAQLDRELKLIRELGFAGYFLIVWDIIVYARQQGILCQGRGSAANSAVCYALGITSVDPIGGKLLFERFLSEGRTSWPDIDLDFPSGDRREMVIQEIFRRYGTNGAAMTANVINFKGKSCMRELGKALGFSTDVLDRFSSLFASGDFQHTIEIEEQILRAGVPRSHPRFDATRRLYQKMYRLPRHLGQHSGGMIICLGRLDEVVPLENASMPGRVVAQWDKDDCDDLGIIKIDILGLGMMAAMQDALELCRRRGHPLDLAQIPQDDTATYDLLCRSDTIGLFQVESRAQMATLPRMQPRKFYDLAIQVGIVRPGPIVGDLKHPYLARRNGEQPIEFIHPDLEPILERTLGVPMFQEQLLRISMVMADFSPAEADELRKALGFKRSDNRMKRVLALMEERMTAKGIDPSVRARIMKAAASFELYGFPESHAISFALIAYGSAYLKVHRASEFYAALLNNHPMGFYSPDVLVQDAKARGVKFRPVCAVNSGILCDIDDDGAIRLGLNYARGLPRIRAEKIVEERDNLAFSSLTDFIHRSGITKPQRRLLAQIGALNAFSTHRRAALWEAEHVLQENDLFAHAHDEEISPLAAMPPGERLNADYRGTGLTVGKHPMAYIRHTVPHLTLAGDLAKIANGDRITVGGKVICCQRPGTANGIVFVSLSDETGVANAVLYSDLFEKLRLVVSEEAFLEIDGSVQHIDGTISIRATDARAIRSAMSMNRTSYDFH